MTHSASCPIGQEPFRIGVSYWPQRSGTNFFRHFDIDEVHEDFSVMAEIGINLARVQLEWGYFQPNPEALRCAALAHLLELCDAAASEGIRIELVLFASSLEGEDTLPSWLDAGDMQPHKTEPVDQIKGVDQFFSPLALRAAACLARGIARTVGTHQAIWAYSLGDSVFRQVPRIRRAAARGWLDNLRHTLHAEDARHPVTCSIDSESLLTSDTLRIDQVLSVLDRSDVDCRSLMRDIDQSAPDRVAAFGCALTSALTGKPCVFQDPKLLIESTSASTPELSLDSLLDAVHRVGALGAVMGTFGDPPRQERNAECHRSGLVNDSGERRPHSRAIRAFANQRRYVLPPPTEAFRFDISADEYYASPRSYAARLYRVFSANCAPT